MKSKIKINEDGTAELIQDHDGHDRYYIGPNGESILESDTKLMKKWLRVLEDEEEEEK